MHGPNARQLVDAAMRAFDVSASEDLAAELRRRYGLRVKQSTVHRWRTGTSAPSYDATLALLDAAGWIRTEASATEQPQPLHGPPSVQDHLEELAAALRDFAEGQAEILRRLPPAAAAEPRTARPKPK